MDRIAKLDNKLDKLDSYNRVIGKFFISMLIVIIVIIFLVFPEEKFDASMYFWFGMMFCRVTYFKLSPHLYIKVNGVKVSIYKCLKDTTISKKDFARSRLKKHISFLSKFLGVCILVHILGLILFDRFTVMNVVFDVFIICIYGISATLLAISDINTATKD